MNDDEGNEVYGIVLDVTDTEVEMILTICLQISTFTLRERFETLEKNNKWIDRDSRFRRVQAYCKAYRAY